MRTSSVRSTGANVSLRNVSKRYGEVVAVDDMSLDIAVGELLTLLGTSGSGKTTTLMMIAGFTEPTSGDLLIGDRSVVQVPPHRRNLGVVFQHYALFPHMTVAENIAFPLQMRGIGNSEIRDRVGAALELVQMPQFGSRFPGQLSGGQQQRVAFARAIVFDPPLLLLDEPLGALDKNLRESMQLELKALHAKLGITMVYVTHDQEEALVLSDRVAVMNDGQLEQVGTPRELYDIPRNAFVADFVGESNFLTAQVDGRNGGHCTVTSTGGLPITAQVRESTDRADQGASVRIMIRPERVLLADETIDLPNRFRGVVQDVVYVGESSKYQVVLSGGETVMARQQNRSPGMIAEVGSETWVGFRPADVLVFPAAN